MKPCLLVILLMGLACASTKPITSDPDIWQRPPGGSSDDETPIPGPLKDFGPFDAFGDALKAACPRFLSKPNATLFHLLNNEKNPSGEEKAKRRMLLRTATEYCAWLYYTPDRKYKMSMLSNLEESGDDLLGTTTCYLPGHWARATIGTVVWTSPTTFTVEGQRE